MATKFSSGKNSIAQCDICGFRFKLKQLKTLVIKTKNVNIKVCSECWSPDHPQLQLGMYPVTDAMAVRDPRPDTMLTDGSRVTQWGWAPVGLNDPFGLEQNKLVLYTQLGTVNVSTT
jgi:hypothetical protein